MGLLSNIKKKFEDVGTNKKVKNVVDDTKKKATKKQTNSGGLTPEEIAAAQAIESGESKTSKTSDKKEEKKKVDQTPRDTKLAFKVLVRPLVTEKSSYLSSEGKYAFEVHPQANKSEVTKAIEAAYDVKPVSVHIMNRSGKQITYGRVRGNTKKRRKAIVTLPKGKTIDIYQV